MNGRAAKMVLVVIVCCGSVMASAIRCAAGDSAAKQTVRQANAALELAVKTRDREGLSRIVDTEASWVFPEGVVQTKREILAKIPSLAADSGGDAEITEHNYGEIAVIQVHRGQAHSLRVWAKREGEWRLLHVGEIVQPTKPDAAGPGIETDCINPCKVVPFRPESAVQEEVLASWQQMETGAYNHSGAEWGSHAMEEFQVVSSWSSKPSSKAERVRAYDKLHEDGVRANTVAPMVWAHMWDFKDAVFMLAEHTRYGGKPDIASRVWVSRDGRWFLAVSYHTVVQDVPTLRFQTTGPN